MGSLIGHDLEQIGSDAYRAVLRAMSEHSDGWVTKAQIRKATGISESKLTNAINALKTRRIIVPQPGSAGVYKLPTASFPFWIKAYTKGREAAVEPGERR